MDIIYYSPFFEEKEEEEEVMNYFLRIKLAAFSDVHLDISSLTASNTEHERLQLINTPKQPPENTRE